MFDEDFTEFFDTDDFAIVAVFKPAAGAQVSVNGIFDNEYVDIGGPSVSIEGTHPVFRCATSTVPGVAHDDELIIESVTYKVKGVQPDGTGETLLILEVQD